VADAHAQLLAAIRRYGPSVGAIAERYTNPVTGQKLSGAALLAKTLQGESGALTDPEGARNADSGKAHGWAQFTPGSRQVAISKYGVDPNASVDEAVHAMALHLRGKINGSTGLEGYNPGDSSYTGYILGQKVGRLGGAGAAGGSGSSTSSEASRAPAAAAQAAPWDTASAGSGLADLLGQLQAERKPQQAASVGLQGPAFSAAPAMPQGYKPAMSTGGAPAASQGGDLASMLQVVSSVQGQDPTSGTVQGDTTAQEPTKASPTGSTRRSAAGWASPTGKKGKIIGTPYEGTHSLGNWQSDNAVDIAVPMGTPIRAIEDGVVEKVGGGWHGGSDRFDGYQVTVRMRDGRQVFYTHLRSLHDIKAGTKLEAGQTIGGSGAANGVEHLHLGVSKGDPRKLIRQGR
jgi:murein DD-endopeptidase MepM/ murein hydrolase activator NlpD